MELLVTACRNWARLLAVEGSHPWQEGAQLSAFLTGHVWLNMT